MISGSASAVENRKNNKLAGNFLIPKLPRREDLKVMGMMSNRKLSKHIADASWGTFVKFLEYKADWNDKQVVRINRFYSSSKRCNVCGWINQDLNLSIREWTCKNGHHLDRDENAAKNILNEGLKIIGAGLSNNTGEAEIRPESGTGVETRSPLVFS